jgi:hypothetical protein
MRTIYAVCIRESAFQIVANWVAPTGQKAYFVFVDYKAVAHTGQCLWFFLTLFIVFLAMRQFEMQPFVTIILFAWRYQVLQ